MSNGRGLWFAMIVEFSSSRMGSARPTAYGRHRLIRSLGHDCMVSLRR